MTAFQQTLSRFHLRWRLGHMVRVFLLLAAIYIAGMLLHGWLDYKWALSEEARLKYNFCLKLIIAIVGLVTTFRVLRISREKVASLADQHLSDPRRPIQAAVNLEKLEDQAEITEMQKFHLQRTMGGASEELGRLPTGSWLPYRKLAAVAAVILALVAVVWGISHWASEQFRVVSTRIFDPSSDLAPYSPLRFAVTPDTPSAVYGGEAIVQVKITGGEIEDDVICLIRNTQTGDVESVAVYREGKTGYAKKFENTLAPVEFAFATGRARSDWHTLDVLLQPKVSSALVTVKPPEYTGQEPLTYPLDSGEIKAPEGSSITLAIESNRPLSNGELKLTALDQVKSDRAEMIEGQRTADKTVSFTWVANRSSKVSAMIHDIRSTPAAKPLELNIMAEVDQAPVVELSSPEQMVLATPKTELPFFGEVEDDYGLAKVSLVRALVGYRDRSRVLGDSLAKRDFDFKEPLKLEEVGVEVGQVLEFYLEALDRNPSLLGTGVSDVVRVKIISEQEYAERIRSRVELDKFTARYRVLAQAVQESRHALKELDEAADAGDPKAFEEAKKKAEAAHKRAQQLAENMAKDFKAFSMEERLTEIAKEAADTMAKNQNDLSKLNMNSGEAAARKAIAEMRERLGGVQKKAQKIQHDADLVKKVGKVMAMAAEFKKIYQTQKSIHERMELIAREVAKGTTRNTGQLKNLARIQDNNRQALEKLAKDLSKHADALPEDFVQMKNDVGAFIAELEKLDIADPMNTAADMARKGKSLDATTNALLALSLMEQLMNKPNNGFCEMCQGGMPKFSVAPDMEQTMQEMLEALMRRASGQGKGRTGGSGGGAGGSGQDGYSVAGNSANIPVYGPDRLAFSDSSSGRSSQGRGGRGASGKTTQQPSNQLNPDKFKEQIQAKILPDNVPAKYRTAVKRYFSQENESQETN